MKIFQINTTCNWGSTGVIAEEIGKNVLLNGWDSFIAYGRYSRDSQSVAFKVGCSLSLSLHLLLSRLFDKQGSGSYLSTIALIKKIEAIHPDIVHLHNIHGYYLNFKLLFRYLKRTGVPVVWTMHDCWAFTGHCAYYTSADCLKWETGCGNCPLISSYPKSIYDGSSRNYKLKKKYFTSIDNLHIITVSDWLKGQVKRSFLGKCQIKRIYNGVDIEIFKPYPSLKEQICDKSSTLILGVANIWDNRKGLEDFIGLSHKLDDNYHIHLVGLSKKQIGELPANGRITGVERTENVRELACLYSSADVYVNFSTEETLGMTNIESLACGTPIIVYDSTACPEAVEEGTGFIVDLHNIDDVADILSEKIKGQKFKYTHKCREFALKKFNKQDRYTEYINLYKEILNIDN